MSITRTGTGNPRASRSLIPLTATFMTPVLKWVGFTVSSLLIMTVAQAQVTVEEPWVRATVPQQNGTGAFMRLTSQSDTTLVRAESPVAKYVEVHEMVMENNVMKMREVSGIPLPAGQTVELKPGGYHIMFIDLHGQVKEGEQVPLKLTFEEAGGQRSSMDIEAPVRPLAAGAGGGHHGHGHGHGHGEGNAHNHGNAHGDGHHPTHVQQEFPDPATVEAPRGVTIRDCWIRALPNRLPAAAYLQIKNEGDQEVTLIGAQAEGFDRVMLHTHRTTNGMAAMVHLDKLPVPAGAELNFEPGGNHVMLEKPVTDLEVGTQRSLTLWFDGNRAVTTPCDVRPAGASH